MNLGSLDDMPNNPHDNVQDKRANFLNRVEAAECKPEQSECPQEAAPSSTKPRGAGFLQSSTDQPKRAVERKCPSKGG